MTNQIVPLNARDRVMRRSCRDVCALLNKDVALDECRQRGVVEYSVDDTALLDAGLVVEVAITLARSTVRKWRRSMRANGLRAAAQA